MSESREELLATARFTVVRHTFRTRDGQVHSRESVQHPGAVAILPLVDAERICLIRNWRVAIGETLWEIPAGTLAPGEEPAACAARELAEETGYRAGRLERLGEFFVSPGILHERMHLFAAHELDAGPTALEPTEDIQTALVTWAQAWQMLDAGAIRDAKTLIALLWFQRRRQGTLP